VRVLDVHRRAHALHVGEALVSVSLCIAGAMAVCAGLVLRMVRELRDAVSAVQEAGARPQDAAQPSPPAELDWPLVLFGVPGTLLLLAGLAGGVWVLDIFRRAHALSLGLALISVSLCIAGEMAWLTSVVLHALRELILDLTGSGEKVTGT